MAHDIIVVGAGVAGLQCARRLAAAGAAVCVLDRARGVGGRCATRRFAEQPVDFGPLFLHGHHPEFLAALQAVEGAVLQQGWPQRVTGTGAPCQPEAFAAHERRFSFAAGLSSFAKHLGAGLEVRLQTRVRALSVDGAQLRLELDDRPPLAARTVVLALPLEQSLALLAALPDTASLASARQLLRMFASLPSLTLIAGYPDDAPLPDWQLCYPEDSEVLQLAAIDSSKRPAPAQPILVYQARPRWSRERLELPAEQWQAQLLEAAGALLGEWATRPSWTHPHRWRYARVDRGNELAAPLLLELDGARLGLAGDIFAPGGGVQAAWLSGDRLARRLTEEDSTW